MESSQKKQLDFLALVAHAPLPPADDTAHALMLSEANSNHVDLRAVHADTWMKWIDLRPSFPNEWTELDMDDLPVEVCGHPVSVAAYLGKLEWLAWMMPLVTRGHPDNTPLGTLTLTTNVADPINWGLNLHYVSPPHITSYRPSTPQAWYYTPLHCAILGEHLAVVRYLVRHSPTRMGLIIPPSVAFWGPDDPDYPAKNLLDVALRRLERFERNKKSNRDLGEATKIVIYLLYTRLTGGVERYPWNSGIGILKTDRGGVVRTLLRTEMATICPHEQLMARRQQILDEVLPGLPKVLRSLCNEWIRTKDGDSDIEGGLQARDVWFDQVITETRFLSAANAGASGSTPH